MLLPVTLLLRRAYVAELIWAAVVAKAAGGGHHLVGHRLGIPGSTVRGWLWRITGRAEVVRHWFVSIAVTAGVDVSVPRATGSRCEDVIAAVGVATEALAARFGEGPVISAVTAVQVAVVGSGARLLSPGWPPAPAPVGATRTDPDIGGEGR